MAALTTDQIVSAINSMTVLELKELVIALAKTWNINVDDL